MPFRLQSVTQIFQSNQSVLPQLPNVAILSLLGDLSDCYLSKKALVAY